MIIKNFISYYYHLYPSEIIKIGSNYRFYVDDKIYLLYFVSEITNIIREEVLLNKTIIEYNFPSVIVINIFNKVYSLINGKWYTLIMYTMSNRKIQITDLEIFGNIFVDYGNYGTLNRSDWYTLWCRKLDYFEYQKSYIRNKYPLLYYTMDYFIGYAEVAISYLNEINRTIKKTTSDNLVICHKRICVNSDLIDFYNPFSLVIDYKARDISEYLKKLLFYGYHDEQIKKLLLVCTSSYQKHLVMARMLFPSFYFDCYENIINGVVSKNEILSILNKIKDYEDFLFYLYNLLKETDFLIRIDFLERINFH